MSAIKLDPVATAKLRSTTGPVDFVDEKGDLIGRYSRLPSEEPLCPWDPKFTLEDAERIDREGDGTTIEEFWKEMGVK